VFTVYLENIFYANMEIMLNNDIKLISFMTDFSILSLTEDKYNMDFTNFVEILSLLSDR